MTDDRDSAARSLTHDAQDFLNVCRSALTDEQIDDFYERFTAVIDEVVEVADCDHENVTAEMPRDAVERPWPYGATLDETFSLALDATCDECGANVPVDLVLNVKTMAHTGLPEGVTNE